MVISNENDEENSKLLIGAIMLNIREIVEKTHALNGLSIASHVDRPAFGWFSQLGFIPPDMPLDSVEVSYGISPRQARKEIPGISNLPCVTSSDAHFLNDIGRAWTEIVIAEPAFEEIGLALQGSRGRRVVSDR